MHCGDLNEIAVEERGREGEDGEEGAWLEEETLKHMKDRMVKEKTKVEDPHPHGHGGYRGGRFGGAGVHREPHGLDPPEPPEPDPMLILGSLVDTLRMAGLRANPRHV